MTDTSDSTDKPKVTTTPLIFISHDARDGDLAESFSKLLKSVSAGMLKAFRSSDKKGSEGIEFGDEWFKTLMTKLSAASDVVCLLTERSLERPWILYEAGVAKGKLDTPVQRARFPFGIDPFECQRTVKADAVVRHRAGQFKPEFKRITQSASRRYDPLVGTARGIAFDPALHLAGVGPRRARIVRPQGAARMRGHGELSQEHERSRFCKR